MWVYAELREMWAALQARLMLGSRRSASSNGSRQENTLRGGSVLLTALPRTCRLCSGDTAARLLPASAL